jgi:hypothetical protein
MLIMTGAINLYIGKIEVCVMHRNFDGSRVSAMQVQKPIPRWRRVFFALVLALAIGSTGQTPLAQAAPVREIVYFSMKVQNPKTTLRCGQTVTYLVKVELAQSKGAPTPAPGSFGFPKGQSVIGVKVETFSVDKNVGDFIATERGFATAKTSMVFDDDLTGLGTKFKFKAKKAGTTTLYFEGLVGKEYVSDKVEVKVLPCNFKVKGASLWNNGPISLVALLDGEIKSDDEGNFTGTTTVNWDAIFTIPDGNTACGGSRDVSATDSQADLTGSVSDSGQVTVNITYQPTTFSISGSCSLGGGSGEETMAPTPLAITIASSGGVSTQAQALTGITGSAAIVIVPVDDEAAAFIPGSQEPLSDVLSNFFGALPALH